MSLNSIFKEPLPLVIPVGKNKPAAIERKTRIDKLKDIKFPVSTDQRKMLRLWARQAKRSETLHNTKLLNRELQKIKTLPVVEYHDTKRYMHVKLDAYHYEVLVNLALNHDVSERKAVALIMWNLIAKEGLTCGLD